MHWEHRWVKLLSITQEILKSFVCCPSLETRTVFLDIFKTFYKVGRESLLFKLKYLDITGNICKITEISLLERFQQVVPNGYFSNWAPIKTGISHGSILGPPTLLINGISYGLSSTVKHLAGSISLFLVISKSITTSKQLTEVLSKLSQ